MSKSGRFRLEEVNEVGAVVRTFYRHSGSSDALQRRYPDLRVTAIEAHECGCEEDMDITH